MAWFVLWMLLPVDEVVVELLVGVWRKGEVWWAASWAAWMTWSS
jgi:hypothetical protein